MQILEKERKRLCETTVSDYIIYNYICSFVLHRFLFDETRYKETAAVVFQKPPVWEDY